MIPYPVISEKEARWLIQTCQAGYWELSLRDSLGKKPIPHPGQIVIFLEGNWHLVPVPAAMEIKSLGRVGNEVMSAACHTIDVNDEALVAAFQAEAKRLGRQL